MLVRAGNTVTSILMDLCRLVTMFDLAELAAGFFELIVRVVANAVLSGVLEELRKLQ